MSKFFVELPVDKYGNRTYTNSFPCVIEADEVPYSGGRTELIIIGPTQISSKYKRITRQQHGGWLEVAGPARPLSQSERDDLIAKGALSGK